MSNTARTGGVDDALLKSVRKLISVRAANSATSTLERLILTPALRVDDGAHDDARYVSDSEPAFRHADEVSKILVLDSGNRADREGLEATIAELEAAVTAQSDDWEPDEGENFEETAWAASAFQSRILDPSEIQNGPPIIRETPVAEQIVASQKGKAAPALGIDESALRALVVEIVHQELSGELGERITRNVRKLVRREINRVMVSKGID